MNRAVNGGEKEWRAQRLTQHTDGGLGGHLDVGGHDVLDGEAATLLLPWGNTRDNRDGSSGERRQAKITTHATKKLVSGKVKEKGG